MNILHSTFEDDLKNHMMVYKREIQTRNQAPIFKKVPKTDLILLYTTFAKYKRVDDGLLTRIWDILKNGSFRLAIGSMLFAASSYYNDPSNDYGSVDDIAFLQHFYGNKNEDLFEIDYDEYLNSVWTPVFNEILQDLKRIYRSKSNEDIFLNIDKLLNRLHEHGNLSGYLVEGGEDTLSYIAKFNPKGIILPANVNEYKRLVKMFI